MKRLQVRVGITRVSAKQRVYFTGMTSDEMADVFDEWNKGELDSFLIEITAKILKYKDTDGSPLVEKIRDTAGQKGTGKWTAIAGLDKGIPVTLIGMFLPEVVLNYGRVSDDGVLCRMP